MKRMKRLLVGLVLGIILTGCSNDKGKEPISLDQIAYDEISSQKIDGLKISEIANKIQKKGKREVAYYWETEDQYEVLTMLCGDYVIKIPFKGEYPNMVNLYNDAIENMKREGVPKEMWGLATMSAISIVDKYGNDIDFDTLKK